VLIGSDLAAVELAEYIAERGRRVTLLAPLRQLMPEVGPKRRQEQLAALDRRRVEVISAAQPTLITENTVEFEFAGSIRSVHADSVVIAGQAVADTRFYDELAGRFEQVHAIGDCTGLGLIRKATEDAMRAACEI
jgi:2,4-dienoyl-CoA reductase (NADPH2)